MLNDSDARCSMVVMQGSQWYWCKRSWRFVGWVTIQWLTWRWKEDSFSNQRRVQNACHSIWWGGWPDRRRVGRKFWLNQQQQAIDAQCQRWQDRQARWWNGPDFHHVWMKSFLDSSRTCTNTGSVWVSETKVWCRIPRTRVSRSIARIRLVVSLMIL